MITKRLLAALAAGMLLIAACGDDDSDGGSDGAAAAESNEYTEALAVGLAQDEDIPFESDQVDCLARHFVAAIGGAEALEDAGISPADLRDSEDISELDLDTDAIDTDALAASFSDCDISLSELILEEAGDQVPDDVKECVADALDEDALAEFFAETLVSGGSGDDLPDGVMSSLLDCL